MLYLCRVKPLRHYLRGFLIAAWAGDKIAEFSFPEISFHFPLRPWFFFVSPAYAGKSHSYLNSTFLNLGSPPRMRGKGLHHRADRGGSGITPAYAGKRHCTAALASLCWDHPRMCGEKQSILFWNVSVQGSPPHVRGKVIDDGRGLEEPGITPACAGKSRIRAGRGAAFGDHPRVCGEKESVNDGTAIRAGSPPHVRGKVPFRASPLQGRGITPACAGKRLKRSRSTVSPVAIVPLFPSVCNKPVVSDGSPAGRDAPLFLPAENAVPASPAYNLRSL